MALCPPAVATLESSPSPDLAMDLAVPGNLPDDASLLPGHAHGEPAQVALAVTDFELLGLGNVNVNPFLATRPTCPAPGLHSEPLSQ